jgi:superfamily II DNA or RNA helicase
MDLLGKLTTRGIVFDYDQFEKFVGMKSTEDLLKELTISKTKKMGNKFTTREETCYKLVKVGDRKMITFARFTLDQIRDKIILSRTRRELPTNWKYQNTITPGTQIDPAQLSPGPTLDSNQTAALEHLMKTVYSDDQTKRGFSSAVLVMGTGTGKSYMAAALIGKIGKKTLVIGPSDVVLKETRDALTKSYPDLVIGEYSSKIKQDGDVVLMIVNSALSPEFTFTAKTKIPGQRKLEIQTKTYKWYEYFTQFGLVIYDEIHNYTSSGRQEIFWRTNFRYGLGLTATPDENSWDMDIIFQKHVGPLILEQDIPGYNQNQIVWQGSVVPIEYHGPPEYTQKLVNEKTGWASHGEMCKQWASDPYRSKLIMNIIMQSWREGRNIFVFARTREHVDKMALEFTKLLPKESTLCQNDSDSVTVSAVLMGGASDAIISSAKQASVIFITYDYGWQGVSIPKMDTIIFATPRMAKMRQIRGRITRKSGDTSIHRYVYDIVDAETEMGKNEFRERKKIFSEESNFKFTIEKPIKINYDAIPDKIELI